MQAQVEAGDADKESHNKQQAVVDYVSPHIVYLKPSIK